MVDTVTNRTLHDGPRNAVVLLTNSSDGTGESAVLKVDVSGLNALTGQACTGVNIRRVRYNTFGMAVNLLWDATADVTFAILQGDGVFDCTGFGGISNNSGAGKTGDIVLTTVGHTLGDTYTLILELEKIYG